MFYLQSYGISKNKEFELYYDIACFIENGVKGKKSAEKNGENLALDPPVWFRFLSKCGADDSAFAYFFLASIKF